MVWNILNCLYYEPATVAFSGKFEIIEHLQEILIGKRLGLEVIHATLKRLISIDLILICR